VLARFNIRQDVKRVLTKEKHKRFYSVYPKTQAYFSFRGLVVIVSVELVSSVINFAIRGKTSLFNGQKGYK